MLLRRITEHVKTQNWFAVVLDFTIVVSGVFIGVQLSNWNDANRANATYQESMQRLQIEITENLSSLDRADQEFETYLEIVSLAFDALQSCEDTPENVQTINKGINAITGTYGVKLRTDALNDATENPIILEQHSEDVRRQLTELKFYITFVVREAHFLETIPLEDRAQDNPILRVADLADAGTSYQGADFTRQMRTLMLNVPITEACKDNRLIKSFYTWERWQRSVPSLTKIARIHLENSLAVLEVN